MTLQSAGHRVTRRLSSPPRLGLVGLAWGALFLNVLTFYALPTVIRIPSVVGQLVTQGAMCAALILALAANPQRILRINLFLLLLTMLALVAFLTSINNEFFVGSTFRAVRLLAFVAVLWLLTPWWGRPDRILLRAHLRCLWIVTASVVLGALFGPGRAFSFDGRLAGTIWPIPTTQVAHYAALLAGVAAVLWMCRVVSGRYAIIAVGVGTATLLATHTRTALIAIIVALAVAVLSLFIGQVRARRVSVMATCALLAAATFFTPALLSWLSRGQSSSEALQLTGRVGVWDEVADLQRQSLGAFFGSGLSNKSFNGLPIDSNWLASYVDEGWFGISVQVTFLIVLVLLCITHPPGVSRAVALLLTTYCIVASTTETGLGDASTYLLDLTVAASLVASRPPPGLVLQVPVLRLRRDPVAQAAVHG